MSHRRRGRRHVLRHLCSPESHPEAPGVVGFGFAVLGAPHAIVPIRSVKETQQVKRAFFIVQNSIAHPLCSANATQMKDTF
jgi:hypothetical protein